MLDTATEETSSTHGPRWKKARRRISFPHREDHHDLLVPPARRRARRNARYATRCCGPGGRPAASSAAARLPVDRSTRHRRRKELAPVVPPPLPAAADKLPIDKLKAPKGFTIDVYASGVDNARTLRLGDKGTVFVSSRLKDKIYAIVDKGGKREVKVVASGLYRPNGIVLHKGTLYIAELSQISKIENVE